MSGGIYGGDEVGALVFDPGSHSFRVGFGGEENPKFDIPSAVGIKEIVETLPNTLTEGINSDGVNTRQSFFIGTTKINIPRADTEIKTYAKDGMIDDWDIFEKFLEYLYGSCLIAESPHHAVLFTEPPWNVKENREKLTELMFERFNVPAFFIVKNAVLAAFANGRTSGLVIDSGATHTSAVPVYDGYCITNAVVRSPIGGDFVADQCRRMLGKEGIEIVPYYKVASKREVKDDEAPIWEKRKDLPNLTKSYENFMRMQLIEDLAQSILQLCDTPIDVESMEKLPAKSYGFPCGFRRDFLAERAKIPESLFDLKYMEGIDAERNTLMNVCQIATTSCGMCDIDIRPSLYNGIMVTGGNSLIDGFPDRLNYDLAQKCPPNTKLKVTAAPTKFERRYGSWIGGSIASSLGSFQQLWISKGEYEESGRSIVERKCP